MVELDAIFTPYRRSLARCLMLVEPVMVLSGTHAIVSSSRGGGLVVKRPASPLWEARMGVCRHRPDEVGELVASLFRLEANPCQPFSASILEEIVIPVSHHLRSVGVEEGGILFPSGSPGVLPPFSSLGEVELPPGVRAVIFGSPLGALYQDDDQRAYVIPDVKRIVVVLDPADRRP